MTKSELVTAVVEKWIPAFITAVIGGIVLSLIVPYIQTQNAEHLALNDKRIETYEAVNESAVSFVTNVTRYHYYANIPISEITEEQKKRFIEALEKAKLGAQDDFLQLQMQKAPVSIFFSETAGQAFLKFMSWNGAYIGAPPSEFPSIVEIVNARDEMISEIAKEFR